LRRVALTDVLLSDDYLLGVSPHPRRFQDVKSSHFITFSCANRQPLLARAYARDVFEVELERYRKGYGFRVYGYVLMPEHVHLLMSEPERIVLSRALQMLKQNTARILECDVRLWYPRYYDFNVHTHKKHVEKLVYIHRNPMKRGLVNAPELWKWSSYRHYLTGEEGVVEIESEWTFRKRNPTGAIPPLGSRTPQTFT
jgi:putative transposase